MKIESYVRLNISASRQAKIWIQYTIVIFTRMLFGWRVSNQSNLFTYEFILEIDYNGKTFRFARGDVIIRI